MYIQRDLEDKVHKHFLSNSDCILMVSGARQTGKTALLTNMPMPKPKLILNLWDETDSSRLLKNADSLEKFEQYLFSLYRFRPDGSRILIIDEAQASPFLGRFIMSLHRHWTQQQVIFSGSVLAALVPHNMPMPVGRIVEIVMRPLNFREFMRFQGRENYFDLLPQDFAQPTPDDVHTLFLNEWSKYMSLGGLPGIVRMFLGQGDYLMLMESMLVQIYRDADRFIKLDSHRRSMSVQFGSLLEHCLKSIARHVAFPTTNSSILSTDSPAYRHILPVVLEAIKSWHLGFILENEMAQTTTKRGYSSKKYIFDTGVMNFLLTRGAPIQIEYGNMLHAQLFENAICQELVSLSGSSRSLTSFKTNNKSPQELDFILRSAQATYPIEVKLKNTPSTQAISQLYSFLELEDIPTGYVIYTGQGKILDRQGRKIVFLPPYRISQIDAVI